jgi:hypothetical protein
VKTATALLLLDVAEALKELCILYFLKVMKQWNVSEWVIGTLVFVVADSIP